VPVYQFQHARADLEFTKRARPSRLALTTPGEPPKVDGMPERPFDVLPVLSAVLIGVVLGAGISALARSPEIRRPAPVPTEVRRTDRATPSPQPLPSPTASQRTEPADDKIKVWPASAQVERGVRYAFTVGHCGLEHVVDFDGSLWKPLIAEDQPRPHFLINSDEGVMTLISEQRAIYRGSTGERVRMARLEGPQVVFTCE
jgi:hypothetical protein